MTEMFGEAWSPMSVPDLAPDDDDECVTASVVSSPRINKFNNSTSRVNIQLRYHKHDLIVQI